MKQGIRIWQWDIMQYLVYGLMIIVPLYVGMGHWFPFTTPKSIWVMGLVGIMVGLHAWGMWSARSMTLRVTWIHGMLGLFAVVLGISATIGVDPYQSWFGTMAQGTGMVLVYALIIFAIIVGWLIRTQPDFLKKIITVSFWTGVVVAFGTYLGNAWPVSNAGGTLGNTSYAGAYLLVCLFLGLALVMMQEKWKHRIIPMVGLVVIIFSPIFLNHEIISGGVGLASIIANPLKLFGHAQGAVIGFFVGVIVFLVLVLVRSRNKKIAVLGIIMLVAMMVGGIAISRAFMNPNSAIHAKIVAEKSANRFLFIDIAKQGVQEYPWFGYGPGNYSYLFQKHFTERIYDADASVEPWTTYPHNIFVDYQSTTGNVGLVVYGMLFGGMFIGLVVAARRSDRGTSFAIIAIASGLIGYGVQNLFLFDTVTPYVMFFLIAGIALGTSVWYRTTTLIIPDAVRKCVAVAGMGIAGTWIMIFAVLPWIESKQWLVFTSETTIDALPQVQDGLQKISVLGGIEDTAYASARFHGALFASRADAVGENQVLFLNEIDALVRNLQQELIRQPDHFRAHLVIAKLLRLRGIIDPVTIRESLPVAKEYTEKAYLLNPKSREIQELLDMINKTRF